MLNYTVIGPDSEGRYSLAYSTPGVSNNLTVTSSGFCKQAAEDECARLNELQVIDRRAAIRDKSNRIVDDLPRNEKGYPDGR